jgi:hypothetical protein
LKWQEKTGIDDSARVLIVLLTCQSVNTLSATYARSSVGT